MENQSDCQSFFIFQKLGGCIVNQVEKRISDKWDEERKQAWEKAYEIITFFMIVRFWMGNFGS